jgi:hypothetical protein
VIFPILLVIPLITSQLKALEAPKDHKFATPLRKYSVIITDEGYYPQELVAFAGERLKLFVTSTKDRASCLLMPDKKLFLSVVKGKVAEGELFFNTAGSYKFYCPTGKIKGKITIMPRKNTVDRKVASENIVNIWLPKDDE